jgi:hypothetical protein
MAKSNAASRKGIKKTNHRGAENKEENTTEKKEK